eukprot:UN26796
MILDVVMTHDREMRFLPQTNAQTVIGNTYLICLMTVDIVLVSCGEDIVLELNCTKHKYIVPNGKKVFPLYIKKIHLWVDIPCVLIVPNINT